MKRKITAYLSLAVALIIAFTAACAGSQPASSATSTTAALTTAEKTTAAPETTAKSTAAETTKAASPAKADSAAWISDTPLKLTILYPDNPSFPFKSDWLFITEIKKRANVELNFMVVPQTDFVTKQMLMLNSAEWFDFSNAWGNNSEFAVNGILLPIEDHLDKTPNLSNFLKDPKVQADINNMRELDGKLYTLPSFNETGAFSAGIALRLDLLEKYGLDTPEDFEQLYEAMKVFKEKDPQSMPIIMFWGIKQVIEFMAPSWHFERAINKDYVYYDRSANKYESSATSPKMRALLRYLNRAFKEELMDPELFTVDLDQWAQKLVTGHSTVTWCWGDQLPSINSPGQESIPGFKIDNIVPLKADADTPPPVQRTSYAGSLLIIPSAIKSRPYFNDMMKFLDWWLYTDEGILLMNWGVEGVSFEKDGDNYVFTKELLNSPNGGAKQSQMDFGIFAYLNGYQRKDRFYEYIGPEAAVITAKMAEKNLFVSNPPKAKMNLDDMEECGFISGPISDYVDKSVEAFVTGAMSLDADWDAYVANIEGQGIQKLVALYNDNCKN